MAYAITGVKDPGTIQPRLELRDLMAKPTQWSLFIRGLNKIQEMRSADPGADPLVRSRYGNNPNSWWQIAGIHGLPYGAWTGDPAGQQIADPTSNWGGYCYHSAVVFPTWHRVLVMLVEQAVVNEAIAYASTSNNDDWKTAAQELRFPFWDWTKPETATQGIPDIFRQPQITIKKPDGTDEVDVNNPLNHYRFAGKQAASTETSQMTNWVRTYRWTTTDEGQITEDYEQSVKAFGQGGSVKVGDKIHILHPVQWLRAKVAGLFQYPLTKDSYESNMWGSFASNGPDVKWPPGFANIEDPHDTVHLNVGGIGTMSINDYAAFDPIFYLHHCNIDRLYAFWEYVYPAYWIGDGWRNPSTGAIVPFKNGGGTFIQDATATVKNDTGLGPFCKQNNEYWTSDDARGLVHATIATKKYYTYPPIGGIKVDEACDPGRRRRYRSILFNEWNDLGLIAQAYQAFRKLIDPPAKRLSRIFDFVWKKANGLVNLQQFYLSGELPEFVFPESGSYRLDLYIKSSSPSPAPAAKEAAKDIVINSISVLGRTDPRTCASCRERQAAGSHIRGYMPLDPLVILHLIDQYDLSELPWDSDDKGPSEALPTLINKHLGMRLVKPDGTRLAAVDADGSLAKLSKLDETKVPKVSLYSHVITFNPEKPSDDISFEEPVSHGTFQPKAEWKSFEAGALVYTSGVRRKAYILSRSQV